MKKITHLKLDSRTFWAARVITMADAIAAKRLVRAGLTRTETLRDLRLLILNALDIEVGRWEDLSIQESKRVLSMFKNILERSK